MFLPFRNLEDFVTWVDASKIKKQVLAYNDMVSFLRTCVLKKKKIPKKVGNIFSPLKVSVIFCLLELLWNEKQDRNNWYVLIKVMFFSYSWCLSGFMFLLTFFLSPHFHSCFTLNFSERRLWRLNGQSNLDRTTLYIIILYTYNCNREDKVRVKVKVAAFLGLETEWRCRLRWQQQQPTTTEDEVVIKDDLLS